MDSALATGFGTGGGLIGRWSWGFDQASPASLLGRRRPGGSSPAAWSLLRLGFSSLLVIPVCLGLCFGYVLVVFPPLCGRFSPVVGHRSGLVLDWFYL